jgi:hypothetical protein
VVVMFDDGRAGEDGWDVGERAPEVEAVDVGNDHRFLPRLDH